MNTDGADGIGWDGKKQRQLPVLLPSIRGPLDSRSDPIRWRL